jgi:hypothetical protein
VAFPKNRGGLAGKARLFGHLVGAVENLRRDEGTAKCALSRTLRKSAPVQNPFPQYKAQSSRGLLRSQKPAWSAILWQRPGLWRALLVSQKQIGINLILLDYVSFLSFYFSGSMEEESELRGIIAGLTPPPSCAKN